MPILTTDFIVNVSPNPASAVIGQNGTLSIKFSNTSALFTAYNLGLNITLPDGVSFVSASVAPDSVIVNPSGTVNINFISIKDLAPNELNYEVVLTVKADELFRVTETPVPFDVPLVDINVQGKVDTLPRGNDDPGNQEIIKTSNVNFIPLRYDLIKTAPGKETKGAGTISPLLNPLWVYEYELQIINNSREPSTIVLIDNLPNGVRYLDDISVNGPDSGVLSDPTVSVPTPGLNCKNFTTLDWGEVTVSQSSINIITFEAAIWDKFTANCIENSGSKIPHNANLTNIATLTGLSGVVSRAASTAAKDILINKSSNVSTGDVGSEITYTLNYRVTQYDDISNSIIEDTLPDGQSYISGSASIAPTSITNNLDGTTTIIWNIGYQNKGNSGQITFKALIDATYEDGHTVKAGDPFTNNVDITGQNVTTSTQVSDSSSASMIISTPVVSKSLLNYYYSDGTPKTIDIAAPGDLVEFLITYSSMGIDAEQKNVRVDEYAPLNMGPLVDSIPVVYGGTYTGSFTPVTVSPNGLRWILGNVPGNKTWTATFKVPVQNIEFEGTRNNLGKLAGENTEDLAYSDRGLVPVNFGIPNVNLTKSVSGPDVNAIKAGEIYTYTINISNPQKMPETVVDAFQMDLSDVIPPNLTYVAGSASVTGTGTYTTPTVVGQNLNMTIIKLPPNGSLTLTFSVKVDNTLVSGSTLVNTATLQPPYSQLNKSYQYTTDPLTATATLRAKGVTMTKLATPSSVKIGDISTYILTVTVPGGTVAYNLKVVDTYPSATQTYIGNATKNGAPIAPLTPPPAGTVTFPTESIVSALSGDVIITYSFDVRVTGGTHVSPFIENQINNATVYWDLSPLGPAAVPFSTSGILQVRTPNIQPVKNQRNVTTGGNFTGGAVNYNVGDVIEYRLTITNNGAEKAYDINVTDTLNSLLSAPFSITPSVGTTNYVSPNLTWNVSELAAGTSATLIFRVTTLPGIGSNGSITDRFSVTYNTNNNDFGIIYGPTNSNTVTINSIRATINKASNLSVAQIGDDLEYTLTIGIPKGTILYKVTIDDLLPTGQTYIGPATLEIVPGAPVTITTSTSGPYRVFNLPTLPPYIPNSTTIDASTSLVDLQIKIKFIARVISGTHSGTFTETQTNQCRIQWAITPAGAVNRLSQGTTDVTVTTPNINLLKEQSIDNSTYTTNLIQNVQQSQSVYYKFTVTSNGASTAENIILSDNIDSDLIYVGSVGPHLGSVSFSAGVLTWKDFSLPTGTTTTLIVQFSIANPVPGNGLISNVATLTYDSNDVNPITYDTKSNQVNLVIEGLIITKEPVPDTVAVGDLIQYTIKVEIPSGIIAYNLEVQDVLPSHQQYDSFVSPAPTSASGNLVQYVDSQVSRTGPLTLNYIFNAKVIEGNTNPPYTEIQTNTAQVSWRLSNGGTLASPDSAQVTVTVTNPHINVVKRQRNVTTGGTFTTATIEVNGGDDIEYEIQVTNDGASTAYTIVTTDTVDSKLTNVSATGTSGTFNVIGNVVEWTVGSIAPGSSETMIITATATPSVSNTLVTNQASAIYKSNPSLQTNLGPEPSNMVSFNYGLPMIIKNVNNPAVFSGDETTYTVDVVVPKGVIIYNAQFIDTLPAGQTYVDGSAKENGSPVTPVISGNDLEFPEKPIIDASLDEVIIEYIFKVTAVSDVPQSVQVNTAKLNWELSGEGPQGPQLTDTETVYVTNSNIQLEKAQRNFTVNGGGPPYFKDPVVAQFGDIILYEFTVTNPTSNTVYNLIINDILDDSLTYELTAIPPSKGNIIVNLSNIQWTISSLLSGESARVVVAVQITGNFVEGIIKNSLVGTFTATDTDPTVSYGPVNSNEVDLIYPSITIEKTASTSIAEVGEIITYFVDIKIPKGAVIYNFQLTDTLPQGQIYGGISSVNNVQVFPQISGQDLIFPVIPIITANPDDLTIRYAIASRIIDGNFNDPFTQTQTNIGEANWEIDTSGTKALPISDSVDVEVNTPFFFIAKSQRNATTGGSFTTNTIFVNKDDEIDYRLVVHNFGKANCYNVVITDILEFNQIFIGFLSIPLGTTASVVGDLLTWTLPILAPNKVLSIVFRIKESGNLPAGGEEYNIANGRYDTNQVTPIRITGFESNKVFHEYPNLQINKASNPTTAKVGDTVRYSLKITVPFGTVAYNLVVSDILPIGQSYVGNATLNGNPVVATSTTPEIVFPAVPFVDANLEAKELVYEFDVLIESANVNPQTNIENQINSARANWYLDPELLNKGPGVVTSYELPVTDSKIDLTKLQKNAFSQEGFSQSTITSFIGASVDYKLALSNPGPNAVYNVVLTDKLDPSLGFVEAVSVPKGTLTHTGEPNNGTVKYNLNKLEIGESIDIIFRVKILAVSSTVIVNSVKGSFQANETGGGGEFIETDIPPTDLVVLVPNDNNLTLTKYQRNLSNNEDFTKAIIKASEGDFVEYKLVVYNNLSLTLYDVALIDILSEDLSYIESVSVPKGTLTHTGEDKDGTVKYTLNEIQPNETVEIIFKVQVINKLFITIPNYAFGVFSTSTSGTLLPARNSNIVVIKNLCASLCKIVNRCKKEITLSTVITTDKVTINKIVFLNGVIVDESLKIDQIKRNPKFYKITFKIDIPYTATITRNGTTEIINGRIKDINFKSNVFGYDIRNKSQFNIQVNTNSKMLSTDGGSFKSSTCICLCVIEKVWILMPGCKQSTRKFLCKKCIRFKRNTHKDIH